MQLPFHGALPVSAKKVFVTNGKPMVTTSTEEVINVIAWNI